MVEKPPPQPLPEALWGEQWGFATLSPTNLEMLLERPIPILEVPEPRPLWSQSTSVPGLVIDAGRQAMKLAVWLQQQQPESLQFVAGPPDGVVLAAGQLNRWILATFDDPEVQAAAVEFERRKQASQGVHFLLVRPDDSGVTYSGLWLLRQLTGTT